MLKRLFIASVGLSIFFGEAVIAAPISFEQLWVTVNANSNQIQSAVSAFDSASAYHQFRVRQGDPKIAISAQSTASDLSGIGFNNLLGQRQVSSDDFSPASLNGRRSEWANSAQISLEWPILDMGRRDSLIRQSELLLRSNYWAYQQTRLDLYTELAVLYAQWIAANEYRNSIREVRQISARYMAGYGFRSPRNPAGYSGWIAYQQLIAQLDIETQQIEVTVVNLKQKAATLGVTMADWEPDFKGSVDQYLAQYLQVSRAEPRTAPLLKQWDAKVEISKLDQDIYNQNMRPEIKLSAQEHLVSGQRSTSSGYVAGVSAEWPIVDFARPDYDAHLRQKSRQMELDRDQLSEQIDADFKSSEAKISAISTLLADIDRSERLADSQLQVSGMLFKNGSISATQWIGVANTKFSVASQRYAATQQYIQFTAALFRHKGASIPGEQGVTLK